VTTSSTSSRRGCCFSRPGEFQTEDPIIPQVIEPRLDGPPNGSFRLEAPLLDDMERRTMWTNAEHLRPNGDRRRRPAPAQDRDEPHDQRRRDALHHRRATRREHVGLESFRELAEQPAARVR